MTLPVIDLDDTDENANWLRILAQRRGADAGGGDTLDVTQLPAKIQMAQNSHDVEQVARSITQLRNGNHPVVQQELHQARHHARTAEMDRSHRHTHMSRAQASLTSALGAMSTVNAMTNNNAADTSAGPVPPVAVERAYEQLFGGTFDDGTDGA